MKISQKGFSLPEVLLVIVVIGVITGIGWFVFNPINKDKSSISNTPTTENVEPSSVSKQQSIDDYLKYENNELGFSFNYPASWKLGANDLPENTPYVESKIFRSPDYVVEQNRNRKVTVQGGSFYIRALKQDVYSNTAEYKNKSVGQGPGSYEPDMEDITIGGIPALKDETCGHPSQIFICVIFVKEYHIYNLYYEFAETESNSSAKYSTEFDKLIQSFKFL